MFRLVDCKLSSVCSRMRGERATFCVMSNLSNSNPQSETQTPASFSLDYHTKQFFDPGEWEGAVEARFFLDSDGLSGREFVGRIATLCTGDPVIAMREVSGDGATLIKRTPYPLNANEAKPENRAEHWAEWLDLSKEPRPSGCPLPVLPGVSANAGVMRLHFDAASGFGAQVWSLGRGYLFDLRDEDSAEKSHHPHVDMDDALGKERVTGLGAMTGAEFHDAIEGLLRDESSELFQVLRFYHLSDDERAMEVCGCDYQTLTKTLDALRLALMVSLSWGGELRRFERAVWHPWSTNVEMAIAVSRGDTWWSDIAAPRKLSGVMEGVCAALGCGLKYERDAADLKMDGKVDARSVALEWANHFHVRVEGVSAHEAVEASVKLREVIDEKTGG